MSDFKAKMHQIRFPLGLWAYNALPDPLALCLRGPTSKGGGGREGSGREGEMRARGKERRGGEMICCQTASYAPQ